MPPIRLPVGKMSNSHTLTLLMVVALTASSLWAGAYVTMAVSYTVLAIFGVVYAGAITLSLFVIGWVKER
ncbi:MAG: hypothetical protein HYU03_01070 [Thaumarchaeota archaeon]|nr:hypothetical protein [Nitrososphaerota archaeon]MCS4539270.1 hypothetical protein [Nitrososphaerota archaeon]